MGLSLGGNVKAAAANAYSLTTIVIFKPPCRDNDSSQAGVACVQGLWQV
jgi:hypothetical protein